MSAISFFLFSLGGEKKFELVVCTMSILTKYGLGIASTLATKAAEIASFIWAAVNLAMAALLFGNKARRFCASK